MVRELNLNNRPALLRSLWRYRYRFALPAAGAFLLVLFISLFVPRTYQATATFRRSSDALLAPAADTAGAPMRRTIEQDVASKAAIEALAEDPALPYAADFARSSEGELTAAGRGQIARCVDRLAEKISVHATVSSDAVDVVEVRVRDGDAKLAADLANRLVERYLVDTRQTTARRLDEADAFFIKQIESRQDELAMLRLQKAQLEQDNPALADGESSHDTALAELRSLEQQVAQAQQEHEALNKWVAAQPDHLEQRTRGRNPEVARLNNEKAQLEKELNEHRYKWGRTDDHPLVKKTLAKIAEVDAELGAAPAIIDLAAQRQANPGKLEGRAKLEALAGTLVALTARRDALKAQIGQAQRTVTFLGRDEYADIQHKMAAAQQDLAFWQNKRRDVMLARSAGVASGGVSSGGLMFLERAVPPRFASFPPPGSVSLLALVIGCAAGLATVIATRVTDRSFDSVDSAQRELELPVLGIVAKMPSDAGERTVLRRAA